MPVAVIVVVIIAVLAATGFFITRDTTEETTSQPTESAPTARPEETNNTEAEVSEAAPSPADPIVPDPEPAAVHEIAEEPTSAMSIEPVEEAPSTIYQDGTFTGESTYFTPRNTSHDIEVEITIEDDVVAAVDVTYDGGEASTSNNRRFDQAYASQVVGLPVANINLSRVGGSSLTSEAFNEALAAIKADARL